MNPELSFMLHKHHHRNEPQVSTVQLLCLVTSACLNNSTCRTTSGPGIFRTERSVLEPHFLFYLSQRPYPLVPLMACSTILTAFLCMCHGRDSGVLMAARRPTLLRQSYSNPYPRTALMKLRGLEL